MLPPLFLLMPLLPAELSTGLPSDLRLPNLQLPDLLVTFQSMSWSLLTCVMLCAGSLPRSAPLSYLSDLCCPVSDLPALHPRLSIGLCTPQQWESFLSPALFISQAAPIVLDCRALHLAQAPTWAVLAAPQQCAFSANCSSLLCLAMAGNTSE